MKGAVPILLTVMLTLGTGCDKGDEADSGSADAPAYVTAVERAPIVASSPAESPDSWSRIHRRRDDGTRPRLS